MARSPAKTCSLTTGNKSGPSWPGLLQLLIDWVFFMTPVSAAITDTSRKIERTILQALAEKGQAMVTLYEAAMQPITNPVELLFGDEA